MKRQSKPCTLVRPVTVETVRQQAQAILEDLLQFCKTSETPFARFEKELLVRVAVLGCCLGSAETQRPRFPGIVANQLGYASQEMAKQFVAITEYVANPLGN